MGPTHAVSGAAVWLGCVLAARPAVDVPAHTALAGAVVAAAAALAPDLDHPRSTATRWAGRSAHRAVVAVALAAHRATRTRRDDPNHDGHRGLTHTLACALTVGVAVAAATVPTLGWWWPALAVTLGWATGAAGDALTRRGVPLLWPVTIRGKRWWDVCPPARWRLHTGGPTERFLIRPALLLAATAASVHLALT